MPTTPLFTNSRIKHGKGEVRATWEKDSSSFRGLFGWPQQIIMVNSTGDALVRVGSAQFRVLLFLMLYKKGPFKTNMITGFEVFWGPLPRCCTK